MRGPTGRQWFVVWERPDGLQENTMDRVVLVVVLVGVAFVGALAGGLVAMWWCGALGPVGS